MISGAHGHIRQADADDAAALSACYRTGYLRAAVLDGKREPLEPSADELRETLGRSDAGTGLFYAAEDLEGSVRLFCALRRAPFEARFGEFVPYYADESELEKPLVGELMDFIRRRGFTEMNLNKITAHRLTCEERLGHFLRQQGFVGQGILREAYYAQGRWHDFEALALLAPQALERQSCRL